MRRALSRAFACVLALSVSPRAQADNATLTLTAALQRARERAPELRAAHAQRDAAAATVSVQRSAYVPAISASVSSSGSAVRDTQPAPDGLFVFEQYSASATLSGSLRWTLWDFGRTRNNVRAADAVHASASARASVVEAEVASNVATAYVVLFYKEQLHAVIRATVAQREKLVTLARGLVKSGLQPPVEEMRAAARADASRAQLAVAEADRQDARAQLAALLFLDPSQPIELAPPRLRRLDVDSSAALRTAEALPIVAAVSREREASAAAVDAARARYRPTLSLSLDGFLRGARFDQSDTLVNTERGEAVLVLSVPIVDASIAPGVRRARADAAAADAALEQLRRDAASDITRAAIAVRTSEDALTFATNAADRASAVLQVIQSRYAQGLASPLELIDAENADSDARIQRTQAEFANALARVRLFVATGNPIVEEPR